MSENLISVIVPIYNTGQPLAGCIDSILRQTYAPIEILLVDDGSTDEVTLSICDKYEQNHANITVIHQTNGGPSKARNTGIESARGRYVAFVDSDDCIDSDAYQQLHQTAKKYDVPLVLGAMRIDGARQLNYGYGLKDGKHTQKEILSKFMLGNWHSACTNLYSKSLIKEIRFPLNEINEDYIFNFEVLLRAKEIAVFNKPFYHYIKQENSRTGAPASMKHLDWLRHTEYVSDRVAELFGTELAGEASYQNLFANIVLSNKCILSIANGFKDEPTALYKITTKNIRANKSRVFQNPYLSARFRLFAVALCIAPRLYKNFVLATLKLKK